MTHGTVSLARRILEALVSGQPGVWVRTFEPAEVLNEVRELYKSYPDALNMRAIRMLGDQPTPESTLTVRTYDSARGLLNLDGTPAMDSGLNTPTFVAALRELTRFVEEKLRYEYELSERGIEPAAVTLPADDEEAREVCAKLGYTVVYVGNAHLEFLGDARVAIALLQRLLELSKRAKLLLVLQSHAESSPPTEVKEAVWVLEHPLPTAEDRQAIISNLADVDGQMDDAELSYLAETTGGLTRSQVESAVAVSLMRHGKADGPTLLSLKCDTINQGGLLRITYGPETFEDLGGLDGIKQFSRLALREGASVRAKGIFLVGCPGTGKSVIARAIGSEVRRPTLTLDIGRLMGGIVGQTESQTRAALAAVDAMAPAVLLVDEAEKALGGGGENDSGVNSRLKGALLTWMSDRKSDVFVVMTANDIRNLPPELTRSGRFDSVFFVDLPKADQLKEIWQICIRRLRIDATQPLPATPCWTGADIEQCCRASLLWNCPLVEAAGRIVPTYVRYQERINFVREWADKATLDAQTGAPYRYDPQTAVQDNAEFSQALLNNANRPARRVGGNNTLGNRKKVAQ